MAGVLPPSGGFNELPDAAPVPPQFNPEPRPVKITEIITEILMQDFKSIGRF